MKVDERKWYFSLILLLAAMYILYLLHFRFEHYINRDLSGTGSGKFLIYIFKTINSKYGKTPLYIFFLFSLFYSLLLLLSGLGIREKNSVIVLLRG